MTERIRSELAPVARGVEGPGNDTVKRALEAVRLHLGMQVAYVSEFVDDRSVFREVDAPGMEALIKVGDSHALDDVYCRHILEGRLPELIPDTAAEPLAAAMPITKAAPIGAHVSVPLRLPDGRVYGMFCCLKSEPDPSLNDRDLRMMKAFADLAAFEIQRDLESARCLEAKRTRVRDTVDKGGLDTVYQAIWNVDAHQPLGVECLTRFAAAPRRPPDVWFGEAAEVGLGTALEIAAIRSALSALPLFPDEAYLAVNASPETILSGEIDAVLAGLPAKRIVIEVTEHAPVADYDALLAALRPLRSSGVRLAVDDAGAGYSSLQHILHLQPDLIKLDISLTRDIDTDPARRALASALIGFAYETHSRIIAEGVETAAELATLRALGVKKAQGYFLGRPVPLDLALSLFAGAEPMPVAAFA
jgi:EAL domain-containing protein (putative c-di-GMP-specific phosphodiesterase class I)